MNQLDGWSNFAHSRGYWLDVTRKIELLHEALLNNGKVAFG